MTIPDAWAMVRAIVASLAAILTELRIQTTLLRQIVDQTKPKK